MVNKFLSFFQREISGLHQAAYLLGVFAFLSQLLAFARDRLLAHSFGAGETLDLYYAAFRIPDFLFATVASTVSLSVLIPVFVDRLERGKDEGRKFLSTVFSFFLIAMAAVSAVAFIFLPDLSAWLFPGLPDQETLVLLSRIFLLSPVLLGLSNLFGSITQAHRRFFLYAVSPLLYNLGIIFGIIFLYPRWGIVGVASGVILGALLHALVQLPFVIRSGLMPKLSWPNWKEVGSVIALSLPRTVAVSLTQVSTLFLLSIASLMAAGSIAIFNLSYNLQSVPLSIVGVSYSIAAFPTLAKLFSRGEKGEFLSHIVASARHIIFWSLPITVLFIVLRAHIVRVILGSGEFGWTETRLAAAALGLFMVSAMFQSLNLLVVRGYYSAGVTRKPLIINAVGAVLVVFFSYALGIAFIRIETLRLFIEALFRVEGIPGTEVLMLPLGFSLGIIVNGILLWIAFARDFSGFSRPVGKTLFQSFTASIIMGFVTYKSLDLFEEPLATETFFGIFLQGFLAGIIGIFAGIILLRLLKNREIDEIWGTVHKKFWKTKPLGPDPNLTT